VVVPLSEFVFHREMLARAAVRRGCAAGARKRRGGAGCEADRYPVGEESFDLRDHLLKYRGVQPVPIIISEPCSVSSAAVAPWLVHSIAEAGARRLRRPFPTQAEPNVKP